MRGLKSRITLSLHPGYRFNFAVNEKLPAAAARAGSAQHCGLLLLLVEVRAVEQVAHLLLEELVQRRRAGEDLAFRRLVASRRPVSR